MFTVCFNVSHVTIVLCHTVDGQYSFLNVNAVGPCMLNPVDRRQLFESSSAGMLVKMSFTHV